MRKATLWSVTGVVVDCGEKRILQIHPSPLRASRAECPKHMQHGTRSEVTGNMIDGKVETPLWPD